MKVGITGGSGFLGWHLRARLHAIGGHEVRIASREIFENIAACKEFLEGLDVLVHCAAATRGDEEEIYQANIAATSSLIDGLDSAHVTPHIVFTSTIAIEKDSAYGRSKRENTDALVAWGVRTQSPVSVLVLPNIFGEFARPFHNTVVATFCHQLVTGQPLTILTPEVELPLIHVQTVVGEIIKSMMTRETGTRVLQGTPLLLRELAAMLTTFNETYEAETMPEFTHPLSQSLFNTFVSYLPDSFYPLKLSPRTDERGSLIEVIKTHSSGQIFFSTTKPGTSRGNHWHMRKMERFCVVSGTALMRTRKLFSNEIFTYKLSGECPVVVDTKTFYVHDLVPVGDTEVTTVFWANEIFDETDPDSFHEKVR